MRRATLRLGLACDNACVFCAQAGLAESPPPNSLPEQIAALRDNSDELTFVGGEPLLDGARILEAVAAARAAGFSKIGVQTNGRRLAALASELARAGLTDAHLSLHGADAAVHDYHTGVDGSFAALVEGLRAARSAGLAVVATTVLTRSNFRGLGALPWFLRAREVSAWLVEVPRVAGRLASGFDRVAPRLGMALPFALHALDGAAKLGLPAFVRGAPLCALGPFAARALPDEPRAFGAACDACAARENCCGVDRVYLARFGGDEISARPTKIEIADAETALAKMFVGVGELASAPLTDGETAAAIAPPPARARVALPLIGKVQPARAEVSAAAPRRSGEALREIFPALFDEKAKG